MHMVLSLRASLSSETSIDLPGLVILVTLSLPARLVLGLSTHIKIAKNLLILLVPFAW